MPIDWEEVVRKKEFVMHRPTGIAAQAIKFYPPGEYHSGGDEEQPLIAEPVVGLADGNAFLADPSVLLVMDAQEHQQYRLFQRMLGETIKAGMSALRGTAPAAEKALDMLTCAMRAQLIAISPD